MTIFNTTITIKRQVFLKSLHWGGFSPRWRTWAGEDVGSVGVGAGEGVGVLVLRSLRGERSPAWDVLARGGALIVFLRVGVRRPGVLSLGGGFLSLLAYLG